MSVEALNNHNEDLFQESLNELKNEIDKPWQKSATEKTVEKAPEMTIDDIMKMTKEETADLCRLMYQRPLDNSPVRYKYYKDKKWYFMLYQGKKLHIEWFEKNQQDGTYVVNYSWSENVCFCFYAKKWNNYKWLYLDMSNDVFYKWSLIRDEYGVWLSKKTWDIIRNNPEKYKLDIRF